jgi:protein-disulfide isomerase
MRPLLAAAFLALLTAAPAAWAQEAETPDAPAVADEVATDGEAGSAQSDGAATTEAADAAATAEDAADADPTVVAEMSQGAEDAPVTVIEYGSFTCPHCADWHEESYPRLKADYIDTGKVRFVFREVYFDRPGLWASMIARCGGEMRFFGIHDLIYAEQSEWIGDGQPATIADNLRRLGRTAGLDDAALEACLSDEARAQALVAWFEGNMEADAIQGTPTFIVNGETHQNMAWEDFQAILDAELAEAGQ